MYAIKTEGTQSIS